MASIVYYSISLVSLQAEPIRVLVTGAAGQIAYSLLYGIAKGDVFGKDQVKAGFGLCNVPSHPIKGCCIPCMLFD